jgi:MYXO-CTERM domain-containing protein
MSSKKLSREVARVALMLTVLAAGREAGAATISLDFSSVFSGTGPAAAAPWLTATFTDVAPGTVRMQVTAGGLTGQETVDGLYFNLDPALNPTSLSLVRDAASTGPTAADTTIKLGTDGFKADGDGFYDINFVLPPPPGSQAARFTAGETLIYQITGSPSLSAASFAFLSTPGSGSGPGPQYAAAHVMQIGAANASGWIGATPTAVPLPAAFGLLAAGAALLVRRRRAGVQLEVQGLRVDRLDQVAYEPGLLR